MSVVLCDVPDGATAVGAARSYSGANNDSISCDASINRSRHTFDSGGSALCTGRHGFPVLRASHSPAGPRPRIAILVPAHNEAAGVTETIASVLPQLLGSDRLLVIADNCSGRNAHVATQAGAEVRERFDLTRQKAKATRWIWRALPRRKTTPDILIIVDADCIVTTGAIDQLARTAINNLPVQAMSCMPRGAVAP